jgi:hypothetical protein
MAGALRKTRMVRAEYDEEILQSLADSLYKQAREIILHEALKYTLVALLFAVALLIALNKFVADLGELNGWLAVGFCVMGAWWGSSTGKAKAFEFKVRAQQILCQMQIERNTRSR